MVNIYYIDLAHFQCSSVAKAALMANLSEERKEKIARFKFEADKTRALFAEAILRYGLKKDFGLGDQDIAFGENEFGKPYLKQHSAIHFNLSHSAEMILCGISTHNLGIDIEKIAAIEMDIAKMLHPDEYLKINQQPLEAQRDRLFRYWALKESYMKYIGKGFSKPLKDFCIIDHEQQITVDDQADPNSNPCFKMLHLHPEYSCAICSDVIEINQIEQVFNGEMLLDN